MRYASLCEEIKQLRMQIGIYEMTMFHVHISRFPQNESFRLAYRFWQSHRVMRHEETE